MSSIWCSANRNEALDQAENGSYNPAMNPGVKSKSFCDDLIMRHYNLGILAGVNGTPGLILEDGTSAPGYRPPKDLLAFLKSKKQ